MQAVSTTLCDIRYIDIYRGGTLRLVLFVFSIWYHTTTIKTRNHFPPRQIAREWAHFIALMILHNMSPHTYDLAGVKVANKQHQS